MARREQALHLRRSRDFREFTENMSRSQFVLQAEDETKKIPNICIFNYLLILGTGK